MEVPFRKFDIPNLTVSAKFITYGANVNGGISVIKKKSY